MPTVSFNRDNKFDIQLSQALADENRLADIFSNARIERIELKSESFQWERTGNIAIEFRSRGKLSGLAATEADMWVHELKRDGETLCYLMFPTDRLKQLCRDVGRVVHHGGDDDAQSLVLVPLAEILR